MDDRDDFYRRLHQLKTFEEAEARERRRLADEMVRRRLVPAPGRDAQDPLASCVYALKRSFVWERREHELKMQYLGVGRKLLDEVMALLAISEHDGEAIDRRMRIREAEQKEKKQAQARAKAVTVKRPGKLVYKTFRRSLPQPRLTESREEFLERCVEEVLDDEILDREEAEEACEVQWGGRAGSAGVRRARASDDVGVEFVLSDETRDRMNDVIRADGWDLTNFKKNPIALFSHDARFPIGKWKNLRVENRQLRGTLDLADENTSARIGEIVKLVKARILNAVSVGFKSIEDRPLKDGGTEFLRQELVETSVVSIPANPAALAIAKRLNISAGTQALVFKGRRP
jgi:HK97 family phage prohead protease